MLGRKKAYYRHVKYPNWILIVRDTCAQFCLPFVFFQLIRTLLFPTAFDVLLLLFLTFLTAALWLEWF